VLFIILESFIKFWEVIWSLALKRWHKYRIHRNINSEMGLQSLACKIIYVIGGINSHGCSVMHATVL